MHENGEEISAYIDFQEEEEEDNDPAQNALLGRSTGSHARHAVMQIRFKQDMPRLEFINLRLPFHLKSMAK